MAKPITHVHFILDNSGSMSVVQDATISGFNEYITTLKKDGNNYRFTLVEFAHDTTTVYEAVKIDEVENLTRETYPANGHSTALYDAVCRTLKDVKKPKIGKHLVVIMTDGQENSSREYTDKQMKEIKKQLEDTGKWTFVYLGANQDAWATAQQFGWSAQGNVATFNATGTGMRSAMNNVAKATSMYAAASLSATDSYFSKQQREEMEATK